MTTRKARRKYRRINNILLVILMVTMLLTVIAFVLNMIRVRNVETGEGETIEETEKPDNEYINQYYAIGYNATDINKQYFRELDELVEVEETAAEPQTEAPEGEETEGEEQSEEQAEEPAAVPAQRDNQAIAASVVKCFITEYYTWTNKDGNYDIGGMQYIFSDRKTDFEKYTRYNFYADMDLYLQQYDRNSLIQVKDVTVNSVSPAENFVPEGYDISYECWQVDASWTYEENSAMPVSEIQNHGVFLVVNHDGRLEIAAINREEVYSDEQWY